MDDKDETLLFALATNARESVVSLARKVRLSRSATQERLARLEQSGIIQGYTVRLGDGRRDTVSAFVAIRLTSGVKSDKIIQELRHVAEVRACHVIAGDVDIIVRVTSGSMSGFDKVRQRLERTPGVADITSHMILADQWSA